MKAGDVLQPGEEFTQNGLRLVYQGDGNLVVYDAVRAVWSPNVASPAPGQAALQGDGNLVLYDAAGEAYWASGSSGEHPVLTLAYTGIVITAHSTIWRAVYDGAVVPIDPPVIPPAPVSLTRLRVEDNRRWFADDAGRFDYREVSCFPLVGMLMAGKHDEAASLLRAHKAEGFTVVRVFITNPIGLYVSRPDRAGFWEACDEAVRMCGQVGLYMRACLIAMSEPWGGVWHSDRRDIWQGRVRELGGNYAVEAAARLGLAPHVVVEIANEPAQIGMRESFGELVSLGRRIKAVAPQTLLCGGAGDGPNDGDTRLVVEPFDFCDAHLERRMGVGGFEWVKRSGEHPAIDQEHVQQRMPFISGEPVNFGELRRDGRNSDVEPSPSVAFAYGAVSRARQYNTCFHYDGGLYGTEPRLETLASVRAYMAALDAFPMLTGARWRNTEGYAGHPANYWDHHANPDTEDVERVEAHLRGGRGPYRIFGVGPYSASVPEPDGWDFTRATRQSGVSRVATSQDGAFASSVYRKD